MERRKRVCEKRNTFVSEVKKKRVAEPRPHPPDCLNKRYWDDVRAGRVPEPSWTSASKPESVTKVKAENKFRTRESLQHCKASNALPRFAPKLLPPPFSFPSLPALPFVNPIFPLPPSSFLTSSNLPGYSLSNTPSDAKLVY